MDPMLLGGAAATSAAAAAEVERGSDCLLGMDPNPCPTNHQLSFGY